MQEQSVTHVKNMYNIPADLKTNMRRPQLWVILFLFFSYLLPATAHANEPFSCCLCNYTANNNKADICLLTATGKSCEAAADTAKQKVQTISAITCNNLDTSKCKQLNQGDTNASCPNTPIAPEYLKPENIKGASTVSDINAKNSIPAVAPKLNIPIPGVNFPAVLETEDQFLIVPYLAIYLTSFQKYIFGISLIAAALMLVYAGFLYILSGTGAKVRDAKELANNALMGIGIVLGCYLILANINPNLVTPGALRVNIIKKQGTPSNLVAAQTMVTDALNVGQCPDDMVTIPLSPSYKPILGDPGVIPKETFCIDKYEAPNQPGVVPFAGVLAKEAGWWCEARGKRLCTPGEWDRACLGPNGDKMYGYGKTFKRGVCNDDKPGKTFNWGDFQSCLIPKTSDQSILNPANPLKDQLKCWGTMMSALQRVNQAEPSGSRLNCITDEGVFDMPANVQEHTRTDKNAWAGCYWAECSHGYSADKQTSSCGRVWGGVHDMNFRSYENGFRCCLSLNPNASQIPAPATQ